MRYNSDTVAPHSAITVLAAVGWMISECGVLDHYYSRTLHFLINCTVHYRVYIFPVFSGIGGGCGRGTCVYNSGKQIDFRHHIPLPHD
jgi:hypothetical protein